ncbi:MAG: polysaccharide biosynthesis/export family protein [Thiohalomonadales bacterium]
MRARIIIITLVTMFAAMSTFAQALAAKRDEQRWAYLVQPGDILQILAWREPDMQLEVLVKPDGAFTIPLAGEIIAANKTVYEISQEITVKLKKYMPDQVIAVAVKQPLGNIVYIIGKVNKAGPVLMNRPLDVVQALSAAGGFTRFASPDDIKIIRRTEDTQSVFSFDYSDIEHGIDLFQNIELKSGDIIVVP